MSKRKSLSLDVMQQFVKDPSTIARPSNTEVDADISTEINAEAGNDLLADISTEAGDDLLTDISTDVDDELIADVSTDVDKDNLVALVSTEVNDELLADVSTEKITDISTEADRTEKSDNPRPQQQTKAKSDNPKPEKTKPKVGSTVTKAEESSLSVDVIEAFKRTQKEATTRFTVDLPQSQHQQFAIVSKKLNTNMSNLARVLIEKFLTEIERDGLL
ncbi:hypothetical protein [Chamaesiphon minutus]|uniref:Uncharacterized protein n=1 Tax=Chamaesiphon minutus (strain ATCC 27169 / PCC 6605) TaxID=1173020 RepID=K9UFW3_CHAP6|nr:hypothetical protein [Chamaesiphon minutus]AFY93104.1 hypothetical protein Cha6605_2000 [Chamaesiphon minutus PCC 6605]